MNPVVQNGSLKADDMEQLKSYRPRCFARAIPLKVLLVVCLSGPGFVIGQKLDSLRTQLKVSKGHAYCTTLHEIAYELVDTDDSSANIYASNAIKCAVAFHDTLQIVKSTRIKARALTHLGAYDSSNAIILAVLPIARKKAYNEELRHLLNSMGLGLTYIGQYDDALRYHFESLELRKRIGASPVYLATALNNIGLVYYKLRDYNKGREYFQNSLKQLELEPQYRSYTGTTVINIALCYAYTGDLVKADSTLDVALAYCKTDCVPGDLENLSFCLGVVALNRHDTLAAKHHFLESYNLARKNKNDRLELDNIVYLSQIFLNTGDLALAERFLGVAEELIKKGLSYNLELMKVYKEFARLYEMKGEYKRAIQFQWRHIELRDSTQNEEATIALMRIEANHVELEKNAEIEIQNKMLELNAQVISRQRIASIFAFSTVVLLAGFVLLLVRSVREKRSRNADLEKRVKSRTAELEVIVKQSQLSLTERKMWIDKILSSVRERTNTVNGLSKLVKKDPESSENCVQLIEQEMTRLLTEVNGYGSRSDCGSGGVRTSLVDA